jgi:hypothetical protein
MRISIIGASISWMVAAACVPAADDHATQDLAVAGRVHGLWDAADGVVLRLEANGVDVLRTVSTNGAFRFDAALAAGSPYAVTVAHSPAQHDCVIEHGGRGVVADASAPGVSVACTGPAVAIALSGAWGWSFDPTQEVQTFAGPLAAKAVALTVSGTAATQARVDGAAVPLGAQTAPIALPLGSRVVPVSFQAGGGLSKTYQLVFERAASVLAQVAYGKASNPGSGDFFGEVISLSGDTLAVGASREDSAARGVNGDQADNSAEAAGAVYVFVRSGTTWSQQAYLKASNIDVNDDFGISVALSGDTLAVGASGESSAARGINGNQNDNSLNVAGAVYVFQRTGQTWAQRAYLKAANPQAQGSFGISLSLSNDTLAVGTNESDGALFSGAVYVFVRSAGQWTQQAFLKASNFEELDEFGGSVAISGDTLVVGAVGEDSIATGVNGNQNDNTARGAGAAYLFTRSGTVWTQQAYLKASNTELAFRTQDGSLNDRFGKSVSVSGSTLVVGAYFEFGGSAGINGNQADNSKSQAGAIYIFQQ